MRNDAPNSGDQRLELDWFDIEPVAARGNGLLALAVQRMRGHANDRDVAGLRILLETAHGLPAVKERHFEVHQNYVRAHPPAPSTRPKPTIAGATAGAATRGCRRRDTVSAQRRSRADSGIATDVTEFDRDGTIYEKGGVKVVAFEVDHGDVIKPCYGYRFEYGGRVAVFSSDRRL